MKGLLFTILILSANYLQSQEYEIFNKEQKLLSLEMMVAQIKDFDVVFFGEVHNDSIGHIAQLDLVNSMKGTLKDKFALSLEMFETDAQLVVDEYMENLITEDIFIKDARAWNTYSSDYKPLVESMKESHLKVIAANAPRRYVKMVTKGGLSSLDKISEEAKTYLAKLPIKIAKGRYEEKFAKIMEGHNMASNTIYQSQNLWDATMAKAIYDYKKSKKEAKVLHICGRFHCEESLGTVAQLKRLDEKLKTVVIVSLPKSEYSELSDQDKNQLGDYLIVTNL